MNKIYFTSDLHLSHNRNFLYEPRGFLSIEEHNDAIVKHWNSIIDDEDDVYVLGDLMLGNNDIGIYLLSQLKGKIHIVLGNHDTGTRKDLYKTLPNVVEVAYALQIRYKKFNIYMSHYPTFTGNDLDANIHTTLLNFYGHTHQKTNFFNNNWFMYHVGLDSHNNYPVEIEEIFEDIRQKKTELNNLKQKGEL